MNGDNKDPLSSAEWLDRFEHDQDVQNTHISTLTTNVVELTGVVGGLAATVKALVDNQKGLFSRQNRPFPWAAIIGGLTLIGLCAGLLIAPVQRDLARQHEFDVSTMKHREQSAALMAKQGENIRWLEKMEDRMNRRIHMSIGSKRE